MCLICACIYVCSYPAAVLYLSKHVPCAMHSTTSDYIREGGGSHGSGRLNTFSLLSERS